MNLSEFIQRIPQFSILSRTPTKLVTFFALFIELNGEKAVVTASLLNQIFDEARVRRPGNTSDFLRKCRDFIRVAPGAYRLSHVTQEKLRAALSTPRGAQTEGSSMQHADVGTSPIADTKNVFVVYGRDERLRRDLFAFLRALGLNPMEFQQLNHLTGSTSAATWQVIRTGFDHAQACVVLFSPDESVTLRTDLRGDDDSDIPESQSRPNVFVEAGISLALQPERTILVKVGKVRDISDLSGMQYVRLSQDAASRTRLRNKLSTAGCNVSEHVEDWLNVGDFSSSSIGR